MDIIDLSITMFWAFSIIFGICDFGERLSGTFDEINDVCDMFTWYLFPCDVQHMLKTLIIIAQKRVELYAFGSISCGRVTLKNVSEIFILSQKKHRSKSIGAQFIYGNFFTFV